VDALAGLRANEARCITNRYDDVFTLEPAAKAEKPIDRVHRILGVERGIVVSPPPLEAMRFPIESPLRWTYAFLRSGLSINVSYALDGPAPEWAVGFTPSEGMEIPAELDSFNFARQKSRLAGTLRAAYFVIKGEC